MGWSVNRPTGLTHHRPGLATPGYTLLTPHGGDSTWLIDIHGRVVHRWIFKHIRPGYGRLLSNGNLLMTGSDPEQPTRREADPKAPPPPFEERVKTLGGYHTTLSEVDWDGNVVWDYVNAYQHHDFYRFANGNTMVPVWIELPEGVQREVRGGRRRQRREKLPRLIGDDLVEVDANGSEVRRIHLWQLMDPVKDPIYPTVRRWEWTHVNGIDINPGGEIVFSARHIDRLGIIGADGELKWKFDQTHGQHQPTWVRPEGEHEPSNVLVFDNGDGGSRVIEIDPASSEIVWSFAGNPSPQFFSGHISGAVQLWSRNVLVCEGTSGRLFEVSRAGEVVWEWINPFLNTNSRGEPTVSIYRTHRYAPNHPALAERDLDPARHASINRLHGLG